MSDLLIVGAGGHGKVVADAAVSIKQWKNIAFIDDRYPELESVSGHPVVGSLLDASRLHVEFSDAVIAVGDNHRRSELMQELLAFGFFLPSIIHSSAYVSPHASIGIGCTVGANAVVNPGAVLEKGVIVNTGATVDHDCRIGEAAHLSPGAHLAGGVAVGRFSWIGIGCSVIQGVYIGDNAIIGAGSVVIDDIVDGCTALGNPARKMK